MKMHRAEKYWQMDFNHRFNNLALNDKVWRQQNHRNVARFAMIIPGGWCEMPVPVSYGC